MKAPAIDLATFEALRESVGPEFASEPVDAFFGGDQYRRAAVVLAELAHA
jgi:hypothetical protein